MELFQVFWDDHRNLFLEFKKSEEDRTDIVSEEIKHLNLKYELSKIGQKDTYRKAMPILVSIKNFFISDDIVVFSIDLDLLSEQDDMQIKFLTLTIFFHKGKRMVISINEEFEMSEICVNEDEISSIYKKWNFNDNSAIKTSIIQERVYKEVSKDRQNSKEKSTVIYEKKQVESISGSPSFLEIVQEGNERLRNVEHYLKDISESLKQMRFNSASSSQRMIQGPRDQGITRIRNMPPKSLEIGPHRRASFLGELKEVLRGVMKDSEFLNFRDILKPMSEEELKSITLSEDDLKKKELEAIARSVKKIDSKESKKKLLEDKKSAPIKLENLKKPIS